MKHSYYMIRGRMMSVDEIQDLVGYNRLHNLWRLSDADLAVREEILRTVIKKDEEDGDEAALNIYNRLSMVLGEKSSRAQSRRERASTEQIIQLLTRMVNSLDEVRSESEMSSTILSEIRETVSHVESQLEGTDELIDELLDRLRKRLGRY